MIAHILELESSKKRMEKELLAERYITAALFDYIFVLYVAASGRNCFD